jgi:hypothetical protein
MKSAKYTLIQTGLIIGIIVSCIVNISLINAPRKI